MGGRGARSSLGTAGGIGAGGGGQPQANNNVQVDNTQVANAFSADYNKFMAMSDDEKADFISANVKQGVPDHLADNSFQRFIYNSGLNEKPAVVGDATLDTMTGTELFRTVNSVYNKQKDLSYTGEQIAKQVSGARYTRVSDDGGSVYGRGIYFANSYGGSTSYGNTRGDVKKTAVMRAKLNSNAKVINHSTASQGASREIASGSKLGKVLSRCDHDSRASVYAMAKGYNVITSGHGYFNILNRNAITVSSDIKAKGSSWT